MDLNATEFYGKYTTEQYMELAELTREVARLGAPEFGFTDDLVCEFVSTNWIGKSNIVTAISFCEQSIRFFWFLNDLPLKFARPIVTLEYLAEQFGFAIIAKDKQLFANYADTLNRIALQLRGVVADLNGDSL